MPQRAIKPQFRLTINSKHISDVLNNFGVIPNKSLHLSFPDWLDESLYSHFLRGYMDGDGCLCITDKTYYIGFTSTEDFINEAIKFFNWKPCKLLESGQAKTWRCADKKLVTKYLHLLYKDSTVYLDRKYNKYLLMTS